MGVVHNRRVTNIGLAISRVSDVKIEHSTSSKLLLHVGLTLT